MRHHQRKSENGCQLHPTPIQPVHAPIVMSWGKWIQSQSQCFGQGKKWSVWMTPSELINKIAWRTWIGVNGSGISGHWLTGWFRQKAVTVPLGSMQNACITWDPKGKTRKNDLSITMYHLVVGYGCKLLEVWLPSFWTSSHSHDDLVREEDPETLRSGRWKTCSSYLQLMEDVQNMQTELNWEFNSVQHSLTYFNIV